ncbi:hypothetical protein PYW08_005386 [Mythimna loreyi]|uniref:Uncharacterized protein n=1 Tax=Mythimna loreyi TaxID=667449 RepID=A0ACC2QGE6_9NEOP|nr:hypothetical protein PYW08_005386 [Mythimna loreyi]
MFGPVLLFFVVQNSIALSYTFNDSKLNRMPSLYYLDSYEDCFNEPDAIFCYGEFALVSDEPDEVLTTAQEYSNNIRHYNHTVLRHGYCMKKTCNEFYNATESEVDLRWSFEACSNKTVYNKYKLKTRLSDELDCSKRDRDQPIDNLDIFVGVICIFIITANIVGSHCDHYLYKGKEQGALKFLYYFSIMRNWKKFVAPAGEGQDPRFKALKGIHGIRAITILAVVVVHSSFRYGMLVVNPEYLVGFYENTFVTMLMSGSLVMQSFFIVSAFLLVYNWLIHLENVPLSWSMLPQQIIMRWLRLTPSYALIIGLTATWFSRLASGGPLWTKIIYYEKRDCRQNWWAHILYINNYVKLTNCMVHTWYLAADTQLHIFGVIIFLLCRTNLTRKVALSFFFLLGIIVPMLHTYYEELNSVLFASPKTALNLFLGDPFFEKVYIRGHTNVVGCVIGMALGYILYNWQKAGGDPKQLQKYRYLYWSSVLVGMLAYCSAFIIFKEGPPVPLYVHVLYAGFQKTVFGVAVAIIIGGVVIQFEGLCRPILEWRPFMYIGRLSYSAFLLHIAFIKPGVASVMHLQRVHLVGILIQDCTIVVGVFIAALFFCLMVEMPFTNVIKGIFRRSHSEKQNIKIVKETNTTEAENGIDMSQTKDEKKIDISQTKDEKGADMSQTKTEDGTIVIKVGTKTESSAQ